MLRRIFRPITQAGPLAVADPKTLARGARGTKKWMTTILDHSDDPGIGSFRERLVRMPREFGQAHYSRLGRGGDLPL